MIPENILLAGKQNYLSDLVKEEFNKQSQGVELHYTDVLHQSYVLLGNKPLPVGIVIFESLQEGLKLLSAMKMAYPRTKLMGLCNWVHEEEAVKLIKAGYRTLLFPEELTELISAVNDIDQKGCYTTPRFYYLLLHPSCYFRPEKKPLSQLTAGLKNSLVELLKCLCQHSEWSNAELAEGVDKRIRTIENQLQEIYIHYNLKDKKELIDLLEQYQVEDE